MEKVSSKDELHLYVEEWLSSSGTETAMRRDAAILRSKEENLELKYVRSRYEGINMRQRIKDSVLTALSAMNSVPRSDPFWDNTNGRATIFKLREFCHWQLAGEPNNLMALWALVAEDIATCGEITGPHWRSLCRVGAMSMQPLLVAGMLFSSSSPISPSDIAECAVAAGRTSEMRSLLGEIERCEVDALREWAGMVEIGLFSGKHREQ